jgi:hypothetical protein
MPIILPMFLGVGWLGVECQVKAGFSAATGGLQATYQRRFGDRLSPNAGQGRAYAPRWLDLVGRSRVDLTGVQKLSQE